MFICAECGALFESPATVEERHPYGMSYASEEWACCPACRDTDILCAKACEKCNEWHAETQLECGLCDDCAAETVDAFGTFCQGLTAAERDYLFENMDILIN